MDAHISTSSRPKHAFSLPDLFIRLKLFFIQTTADFLVAVTDPYRCITCWGFEPRIALGPMAPPTLAFCSLDTRRSCALECARLHLPATQCTRAAALCACVHCTQGARAAVALDFLPNLHANTFAFAPAAAGDIPPTIYEGLALCLSTSGLHSPCASSAEFDDEYDFGQCRFDTLKSIAFIKEAAPSASAPAYITCQQSADVVKTTEEVSTHDEEKDGTSKMCMLVSVDVAKALQETPAVHDVFSFQHLQYAVPVGGGNMRRVLDGVSGVVPPCSPTSPPAVLPQSTTDSTLELSPAECSPPRLRCCPLVRIAHFRRRSIFSSPSVLPLELFTVECSLPRPRRHRLVRIAHLPRHSIFSSLSVSLEPPDAPCVSALEATISQPLPDLEHLPSPFTFEATSPLSPLHEDTVSQSSSSPCAYSRTPTLLHNFLAMFPDSPTQYDVCASSLQAQPIFDVEAQNANVYESETDEAPVAKKQRTVL
ncbi:hypothetical protein A0H81_09175 [Grifola frondosa]|uniref:Uncharacterized protein n=1 Tax=Grifola frondosa TaxID=5627 RepID=A0A1C7M3K0_GRIFR|nr:hypothetical protein A0H81_09175 [Grifola frondosa]